MRRVAIIVGVLAALLVIVALAAPPLIESKYNRVLQRPPYKVSATAQQLHQRLIVADLHADTLLWSRSLLARSSRGHVDLPRLRDGNIALQAFTVVTKVPRGMNIDRNTDADDLVRALAIAERWPPATWSSLRERALYQARRLHLAVEQSGGQLALVRTRDDLRGVIESRQRGMKTVGAILGLEGAHALESDLSNLSVLYEAGFRMIAPTHFFDTDLAGSASGVRKGGLTAKGREWVRRMEERGIAVDLAHASEATIMDVTAMATRPVLVSHTGVRGACDNRRNLTDQALRAISRTGGVVGIGYWSTATCGNDAKAIARAIRHAVNVAGVEHVALGSDFDGAVTTPFDASGVVLLTEALLASGFSEADVGNIMGGNVVRVFGEILPQVDTSSERE